MNEQEWDAFDNEKLKLINIVEEWIEMNYGKRCQSKVDDCPLCKIWSAWGSFKKEL